ncbi:GMC family oxidoreductase [Nonomuraea sp. NPDC026600]|uniref:GMC family oxidoreductase n=1 Tax=Nonomuraea sp. NPDC026600 TaxID=3155363 RepID=UPI0033EF97CF
MVSLGNDLDQRVRADIAVLGGGTAGAVVAGRLIETTSLSVVVVEAGPDYGPFAAGRWPRELLDSSTLPETHDWGYRGPGALPERDLPLDRARVIGGCSSHNGCSQTVGHAAGYRSWGLSWTDASITELMRQGAARLRVRLDSDDELTPFQAAAMEAMIVSGVPRTDDLDDLFGGAGCGPSPVNNPDGVRWNSAFAYLDPVRGYLGREHGAPAPARGSVGPVRGVLDSGRDSSGPERGALDSGRGDARLRVVDHALVERLELHGSVVRRAHVRRGQERLTVEADRFVLCGGAYGSPEVLLRSGIGPAGELAALGVEPRLDLPGVGRNLHDHPTLELRYAASDELVRRLADHERERARVPDEQVIGKALSPGGRAPYDLHLLPWTGRESGGWTCVLPAACLTPRSRGALRLTSPDPGARPIVDHAYLTDPEGSDLAVLRYGIDLCRRMAASPALAPLLGRPLDEFTAEFTADRRDESTASPHDGSSAAPREGLTAAPRAGEAAMRAAAAHYWHPVGTCAIGTDPDAGAVVDASGRLYGTDNLWVIDASIIPVIPRATTNLPVVALAEHLVRALI